jgi:hypothetical protein
MHTHTHTRTYILTYMHTHGKLSAWRHSSVVLYVLGSTLETIFRVFGLFIQAKQRVISFKDNVIVLLLLLFVSYLMTPYELECLSNVQ